MTVETLQGFAVVNRKRETIRSITLSEPAAAGSCRKDQGEEVVHVTIVVGKAVDYKTFRATPPEE